MQSIHRTFRYRLYPNSQQRAALERILEVHRQLYNAALQERREAWKRCRINISYLDQANQLKAIRTFDRDAAWLNYTSTQQTLRRLDKAFHDFFLRVKKGNKPGYPRFKGKGWFKSVIYVYGDGIKIRGGRLYIQNVGVVRMFLHRCLPEGTAVKQAVLKREGSEKWFANFQVVTSTPQPTPRDGPAVGIDMGLRTFATLSTGETIKNPRWFRQAEEKVAILQRHRARCQRGSKRSCDLTKRVCRTHERIANQRRDFHHKISTQLIRHFGLVAVEDLGIKNLLRGRVAKSISDAGWRRFFDMLAYKAESAGVQLVKVAPNGTSQRCARCGATVAKDLSVLRHRCPSCGFSIARDLNAALNVLALARARTEPPRKGFLLDEQVAGSRWC